MGWTPHGHWMDFSGRKLEVNGNGHVDLQRSVIGAAA
jgi:hypothetical protein